MTHIHRPTETPEFSANKDWCRNPFSQQLLSDMRLEDRDIDECAMAVHKLEAKACDIPSHAPITTASNPARWAWKDSFSRACAH